MENKINVVVGDEINISKAKDILFDTTDKDTVFDIEISSRVGNTYINIDGDASPTAAPLRKGAAALLSILRDHGKYTYKELSNLVVNLTILGSSPDMVSGYINFTHRQIFSDIIDVAKDYGMTLNIITSNRSIDTIIPNILCVCDKYYSEIEKYKYSSESSYNSTDYRILRNKHGRVGNVISVAWENDNAYAGHTLSMFETLIQNGYFGIDKVGDMIGLTIDGYMYNIPINYSRILNSERGAMALDLTYKLFLYNIDNDPVSIKELFSIAEDKLGVDICDAFIAETHTPEEIMAVL